MTTSELKYRWFEISYNQYTFNDIRYMVNNHIYYPNGKPTGGGLISLRLYGRDEEIFQNRKYYVIKHLHDIQNDVKFKEYIFHHIFGHCHLGYDANNETELIALINNSTLEQAKSCYLKLS